MHKLLKSISLVALAAGMAAPSVQADAGDWLVRLRAIHVAPSESAEISAIGGDASIDTATVPELDISYFLTDKVAVELILATTKHSPVAIDTAAGDVPLGSVRLLPPTLNFQYHPMAGEKFSPYFGAGINYTMFYDQDATGDVVTQIDYDNSFGFSLQAGADIEINDKWFFNADVKKLWLGTDVSINNGAINADVDINPWIIGVGFGRRF
ncbi:membrane protein [Kordiimonas sediminis]|uniref:Membrane protein n=1 Tax=Kordiimonas sediminis TaxID=1735581 RepID=A0A919AIZ8_9PROT|nr:OmpW family outer membrane protein [Kordiimonas sediminis]GHF12193.1 membrane protein [Kordiimonas sediminis]